MIPAHLLDHLPLLADGAPAAWLRARHPGVGGLAEALNLRRPDWVQAGHAAFFQAGANVLRTNSAQANAVVLAAQGLEERCEAINNSATALLRAAVGQQALVVGTVAEIRGAVLAERERAYGQQIVYLSDTGVDFLLLEDCSSVAEAVLVRRLARDAGDVPVLAVLPVDARGRTAEGQPLREAVQRLADGGMDAVGALFPREAADLRTLLEPALTAGLPLAALLGGESAAALTPEVFASRLAPLAGLGVAILGGGASIGPAHVAALADRLNMRKTGRK
jgi:homocysteine S-methyltransferase